MAATPVHGSIQVLSVQMQVLTLGQQALLPPCHLPGPHFPILTQQTHRILSHPSCLLRPLLLCRLQAIYQNNVFFNNSVNILATFYMSIASTPPLPFLPL